MRRDLKLLFRAMSMSAVLGAVSAANAQAPAQTPAPSTPDNQQGQPSEKSLSKKLDESKGVLTPPHGVDPEIHQAPPANTGDKMPVIIPPGEPGGDQSVQPK